MKNNPTPLSRTTPPPVTTMSAFSLPDVRRRTLPSGIEMITYDKCAEPVNFITYIAPGGTTDRKSPAIAALDSILRREGTASFSGEEINRILDFNGAWLKPESSEQTFSLAMRSLNSTLEATLPVFKEMIFEPVFHEHALAVRREGLAKNIEVSMNDVDFLAACASDKITKGATHPAAKVDTPDEIRAISRNEMLESFRSTVSPSSGKLFIAGNITPQIEEMIAATFSEVPFESRKFTSQTPPYSPKPPLTTERINKPDALQSAVIMTIPTILRSSPDYIPLHIAVSALGGYFGSRLMTNIRERLGLTYGISASLLGNRLGSYIQIYADTDCRHVDRLCEEVCKELTELAVNPPRGEELTRLKQYLLSSQARILDSPFSTIGYYISAATSGIPEGYFNAKLKQIESLTPDLISEISARYIRPELLLTAIAGK